MSNGASTADLGDGGAASRSAGQGCRRSLRELVREGCENRPGVYRFHGPGGRLLYVGKSVKVRTRLLSYFRAGAGEKAAEIVGHAHGVAWDYEPSEFAALLRELRLIQRERPPYNVVGKRSRAYCFVKLTRGVAPRLLVVRRVVGDGARYYGPFRGIERVRGAVREVADLLGLRDCAASTPMRFSDQGELFGHELPALCPRADLGRCLGPCAGRCGEAEYRARVGDAVAFLEGRVRRPVALLEARMRAASERLQYEYAAELRDRAHRLSELRDELVTLNRRVRRLSVIHTVPGYGGEDRVYVIRAGRIRHEAPAPRSAEAERALWERAREIFEGPDPWRPGVSPEAAAEILLVLRWLGRRSTRVRCSTRRIVLDGSNEWRPSAGPSGWRDAAESA